MYIYSKKSEKYKIRCSSMCSRLFEQKKLYSEDDQFKKEFLDINRFPINIAKANISVQHQFKIRFTSDKTTV